MKRILVVGSVLAASVVGVLGTVRAQAGAVVLYHFVGTVTDPLGRPLSGATVTDRSQFATTAADGSYSLSEGSSGTFTLIASKPDSVGSTKIVTVVVPADTTVDFTLEYLVGGTIAAPNISTASGPASRQVTISTGAPVSGTCVLVTDSRTGQTANAAYVATNPDGTTSWTWTLSLPQLSPEGEYSTSFIATECGTGQVLSNTSNANYIVDNTPPTVTGPFPTGVTTASPTVGAQVIDQGSGVNPSASSLVVDGVGVPSTYDFGNHFLTAQATGLTAGKHTAAISASDYADNQTTVTFSFSVDDTPPSLSQPSPPAGSTINNPTPLISLVATDAADGIDGGRITMTLSDGLRTTGPFTPRFDAATGRVSYQVPTVPTGLAVGQYPLMDGAYTVRVDVHDVAGNPSTLIWSFTMSTLPR